MLSFNQAIGTTRQGEEGLVTETDFVLWDVVGGYVSKSDIIANIAEDDIRFAHDLMRLGPTGDRSIFAIDRKS